jgi:epoxyqueuosine reductase QueG
MTILASIFNNFGVPLWAVGNLRQTIPASHESYVVFCLPYSPEAIEDLPDDSKMNQCKSELESTTKQIYRAIIHTNPDANWDRYDKMDQKYGLQSVGISQKVLAHLAGLGWIGRSSLLVTERYGAQTRIGTIFTNTRLSYSFSPHTGSCGNCRSCIYVCPTHAISNSTYNVTACRSIVRDANGDYLTFCGLCMKACSPLTVQAIRQDITPDAAF